MPVVTMNPVGVYERLGHDIKSISAALERFDNINQCLLYPLHGRTKILPGRREY
jgi:hypothetical protein